MPLNDPQLYELTRSESPPLTQPLIEDDASDVSELDQLGPVKRSRLAYRDDVSQPLANAHRSEKDRMSRFRIFARHRKWQRRFVPSRFWCMLVLLFAATIALLLFAGGFWVYETGVPNYGESEPWYPTPRGGSQESWAESYRKAADLVSQMTLVEKVNVTTGTGWAMGMCVGNTGPVQRLGFPSLCLQDGPLGLRFVDNATAFPAGITVGASWNKDLMYERGRAHGFEARLKGINVILGPSMGPIGRIPAGGRNWEGFGADPVLQGIAAAQTIRGIQDSGVIATAKHYVGNEQEHYRQPWEWGTPNAISSNIDDRTLHEIYAWPFAESVRAGVASVMCSYNQINNSYACQNSRLLNGILKDELGFQGFIQSDWLAQRSGVASALAGLDMTMPGDGLRWTDGKSLWGSELTKAVLNSSLPVERFNDMVLRIVAAWYQLGQDDASRWPNATDGGAPNFSSWTNDETGLLYPGSTNSRDTGIVNKYVPVRNTEEGGDHDTLARQIAVEGIVLVKNDGGILPLSRNGSDIPAQGSSAKVKIGIFGEDAYANSKGDPNACADRGCNEGTLAMGWGSGAVDLPYLVTPAEALYENFDSQTVQITDWGQNEHADTAAADQDLCLVFINSDAGEGFIRWNGVRGDRNDLYSQKGGDDLVQKVAANCGGRGSNGTASNTIVVLHTVGPTILEKWVNYPGVKAVLIAHLPGQESGNALADVLFGDVNPSGRLPYTIAKSEHDYGPYSSVLRIPNSVVPQQNFTDGPYFDYRYFDKHEVTPRYEFGFGLSYTSFEISGAFIQVTGLPAGEPAIRPPNAVTPPRLEHHIPDPATALWPKEFRKLKKYIYPYIDRISDLKPGRYDYPNGYAVLPTLSRAGGSEGGNPDLFEIAANIKASVTNIGPVAGDCVVQLYVEYPKDVRDANGEPVDFPRRVLRGFEKIPIGTTDEDRVQEVHMHLTRKDLSYWDVVRQNWIMPEGTFAIGLGFSSRNLPAWGQFEIHAETEPVDDSQEVN